LNLHNTHQISPFFTIKITPASPQGVALVVEAAVSFSTKSSPLLLLRGAALGSGRSAPEEELAAMKAPDSGSGSQHG